MSTERSPSNERGPAAQSSLSAGIVAFITRPLPELRTALRSIRETAPSEAQLAVVAIDLGDQDATYLLRQYLRGRIQAVAFEHGRAYGCCCGLDRTFNLVSGEFIARVDDTLDLKPGWLERAVRALEADPSLGCLSLVPPSGYQRGRGRPRTVNVRPIEVERLDMRCFVTRRSLIDRYSCELASDEQGDCRLQDALLAQGLRVAFLPGQVSPLSVPDLPADYDAWTLEDRLPPHEGASGALQRLEQAYHLGDDVLLTCLSCGGTELETLAARIRFCERHQVAIGFWYELRCPQCGELHYKDDYQFRCPD